MINKIIIFCFAALVLGLSISYSQEIVSTIQTESRFNKAVIQGDVCYTVTSWGLETFDISDMAKPIRLSSCPTPGEAIDLDIQGSIAYIADGCGGMAIIDISDPKNLKYITSYIPPRANYNSIMRVFFIKARGGFAYLSAFTGLYTVDINDPSNPVLTHRLYFEDEVGFDNYRFYEPAIKGDRMYVCWDYLGMTILDLSDPSKPEVVANFYNIFAKYTAVDGDVLYGASLGVFQTLDISNEDTIVVLDTGPNLLLLGDPGGDSYDLTVNNGMIVIPLYKQIWIADVSDPAQIDSVALITEGSYHVGCAWHDSLLVVCSDLEGMQIWDTSNPGSPLQKSDYIFDGHVLNIARDNDHLYMKGSDSSIFAYDVADRSSPLLEKEILVLPKSENNLHTIYAYDNLLYVANDSSGLFIFSLRNPSDPTDLYIQPINGKPFDSFIRYGKYLITGMVEEFQVFEQLSDGALSLRNSLIGKNMGRLWPQVQDHYLYAASNAACFQIYDISNLPEIEILSSTCYKDYVMRGIAVKDSILYVGLWENAGIDIFNISDKFSPQKVTRWPDEIALDRPLQSLSTLQVFADFLFLFNTVHGLLVLDISDPYNPSLVASFDTPGYAFAGIIDSSYVYCADVYGVTIIKHNLIDIPAHIPKNHRLISQNYPNPFNSSTVIGYAVPIDGHVELDIYNVLGQKVVNLVDADKKRGDHFVFWDGKNSSGQECASGIYLCRLKTGEYEDARTMALVR